MKGVDSLGQGCQEEEDMDGEDAGKRLGAHSVGDGMEDGTGATAEKMRESESSRR